MIPSLFLKAAKSRWFILEEALDYIYQAVVCIDSFEKEIASVDL